MTVTMTFILKIANLNFVATGGIHVSQSHLVFRNIWPEIPNPEDEKYCSSKCVVNKKKIKERLKQKKLLYE